MLATAHIAQTRSLYRSKDVGHFLDIMSI